MRSIPLARCAVWEMAYYSMLSPARKGKPRITDVTNFNDETKTTVEGGITTFVDSEDTEVTNVLPVSSLVAFNVVQQDIQEFLKRPVEIYSFSWDIGGSGFTIDPYTLWLSNPAIARKLSNFMFIRTGGLQIRVVTNGTPYLYGSFSVSFWPNIAENSFATNAALASPERMSNLPQHMCIDPSVNSTTEMQIVEFLKNDQQLTIAASTQGSLIGIQEVALQNASGTGTTQYCEISIYASAINPQVMVNTYTKSFYATSAEYKGKVSAPLGKVAKVGDMLKNVPIIGTYASAVGQAADLGARVAALFGYSKPVNPNDPTLMVMRAHGNMTNTEGLDTASSLTFAKQSQSIIDPSYFNLKAEDELAIAYIIRRWSLVPLRVTWADTDAVNTVLESTRVGPHFGYSGSYPCAQTNLGHISDMFRYWRGNIEVKAVFCVSQFHTGRLQIIAEPSGDSAFADGDPTNVVQNWIVDLKEQREVEMVVPFSNTNPFVANDLAPGAAETFFTLLSFRVINKLRAGSIATTVSIKLYVRAGEDFEFNQPTLAKTQNASLQYVFQPSAATGALPTNSGYSYFGTSGVVANYDSPVVTAVHMTERIVSLRTILKRYQFEKEVVIPIEDATGNSINYKCIRDYPNQPGSVTNGVGTSTVLINTIPHNAMTWLGPCYAAWRGSIKTKIFPYLGAVNGLFVNRAPHTCSNYMEGTELITDALLRKWLGSTLTGIEYSAVQVPAYFGSAAGCVGAASPVEVSNHWTDTAKWRPVSGYNNDWGSGSGLILFTATTVDSGKDPRCLVYKAIGEDFMYLNYIGPPMLYQYSFA